MLDFQRHPVKIAHINVRTETHGDEEVTAVDLKLTFDVPNFVLDKLSPTLRPSLYEAANDDIFGPDGNTLSHVKNPQLGRLNWAGEHEPVSLHLHCGVKPKDDLLFTDSTFGKINFEVKEGGTCSFATRVQILPNAAEAAKPMMLLKHEVLATLDTANASNIDGPDDDGK